LLVESGKVVRRVVPRGGRALFFRHGIHSKSVLHAGDILGDGVAKYVVRINVMYQSEMMD